MSFFDNYHRGDPDQALHRPSKTRPAGQISSVYEDLFDQLIQGHSLTVPRAHVSINSLKTQWVRWRQKLPVDLGFDEKVLETEDIEDNMIPTVYVRVFLRAKRVATPVPFTLNPVPLVEPDPNANQEAQDSSSVPTILGSDQEGL